MTTSIFDQLRDLLIQLLQGLDQDPGLHWDIPQIEQLEQRFSEIHENLRFHFAQNGILTPSDAASRLSDHLFHEFGELLSELDDQGWTAKHCGQLGDQLHRVHQSFDHTLDKAVDDIWREQSKLLPSDLTHHLLATLRTCERLLSDHDEHDSDQSRARQHIINLITQLTTKGESLWLTHCNLTSPIRSIQDARPNPFRCMPNFRLHPAMAVRCHI